MKRVILSLLTAMVSAIPIAGYAQKITIIEGDLSVLQNEQSVNTAFTYENMSVGKYKTEAEYVAMNKDYYNSRHSYFTGRDWYKLWIDDRQNLYEPRFNELFEKYSSIKVTGEKKDAKFTVIYKTISIKPDRYSITGNSYAETDAEVWIVETVTNTVVVKILVENARSSPFISETGERIAACYADAGKALAKLVKKR